MSDYHETAEQLGVPFGFNLSFDKNITQLTIERLSAENTRLKLQLEEAHAKIQRLINESCEGEEL
jgi:hypothetical protein